MQRAPLRMQNLVELYLRTEQLAGRFEVKGNIEIDNGFSFAYQVQVFFATYFAKQVIESSYCRYN